LAGGLQYALLIHGKPLFSTNASRLRFGDLTQCLADSFAISESSG